MDQKTDDGATKQSVLNFKCKKMLHEVEKKSTTLSSAQTKKSGVVDSKNMEPNIACQTPEKINEGLHSKFHEGQVKLPDKYRTLVEFFDRMSCSLRLLSLYKRSPTFGNISTQIGVLMQRKFSYRHLAQMKYILPEALQIEMILIHDKRTLCMKPDMKITLLFEVVEGHSQVSDSIALSQVFFSRLYNFFTTHTEASDVPEAILPEPFTRRSEITVPDELSVDCCVESQQTPTQTELFSEKFNPHFSRHFSQNAVVAETEKTKVLASVVVPPIDTVDKQDDKNEQQKKFLDPISVSNCVISQDSTKNAMQNNSPGTCSKSISMDPLLQPNPQCSHGRTVESPVFKLTSYTESLTIETPLQSVPKRSVSSYDVSDKMITSQGPTPCCKPAKRALDFFYLEGDDESALDSGVDKSKCNEVVCEHISQISEGFSENGNICGLSSPSRELEEGLGYLSEVCNKSQTGEIQQNSSSLVDMVALIRSIFKSANCSPITKEELVHKIIMNSFDIVDKREVEEQIDLLERLVPDWIYRKLATSGDIMYNIKDVSDLDSIRAKLISA